MTLGIGVVGVGGMGARHGANIQVQVPEAEVTAVFDPNAERARNVSTQLGAALADDALSLITRDDVDGIVIASPDETHAELTMHCLRTGKPVLCEKPLALSPREALEIVECEARLGRQLVSVGFMRRFDPYHVAVKTAVRNGAVGRPAVLRGVHRTVDLPPGYGPTFAIAASAVHDIDVARWLLAEEITRIRAMGRRVSALVAEGTFDLVLLEAQFAEGSIGVIEVFQTAGYGYEVIVEIVGDGGVVVSSSPPAEYLPPGYPASPPAATDWLARFKQAYIDEMRAWIASILDLEPFRGASAWDGLVAVATADAALTSLETGQAEPVDLPTQPGLRAQFTSWLST